ncbi:MAG: hypothetical protein DBX40_03270 [Clostridiales bacterium]|nr:MAG: hypothetical protein DBX40_03270 [Clostridiales bacterium]
MSNDERAKCHAIIHTASVAAGAIGAGLAQIPISDNLIISPIQLTMIISLGQVFGIQLTESAAASAAATATASVVGKTACQLLLGWIPVLGNFVNAGVAAGITESIGWMLANEFAAQTNC